jgi:hypothetical protein
MSLALVGVRYKADKRGAYLHHSNWLLKLGAWVVFNALPFFFPNSLVNAYGEWAVGAKHTELAAAWVGTERPGDCTLAAVCPVVACQA